MKKRLCGMGCISMALGMMIVSHASVYGVVKPEIDLPLQPQAEKVLNRKWKQMDKMARMEMKKVIEASGRDPHGERYVYRFYPTRIFQNDRFISLIMRTEQYTGGAHGMVSEMGYVFDAHTGRQMTAEEILGYTETEWESVVRTQIERWVSKERNRSFLSTEGLKKVLDARRKASWNFYLDEIEGVVLLFNPYEIAPYSAGIIRIPIGWGRNNEGIRER